jgi:hypothetical protein
MANDAELEDMARTLQLMVAARRRMRMNGDQEGVELMTRYFQEIDKMDARLVKSAENSVAGCGVSISDRDIEAIKASVHQQLGDAR